MALSTILRRSASRIINGGNRFYGNLILPSASVSAFRQFCSSPLSSMDNESLVNDAKPPSMDESLVNNLIARVQSLQRDIELLRNSYSKPLSTVKEDVSLVKDEGNDESESVHKGIDDDSSLKAIATDSSNDEGQDSESDKSDDDSSDDSSEKLSSDSDKSSDDNSSDDSSDDSNEKLSSDSDKSSDDSLFETDDTKESSDHESLSESLESFPERDDKSLPKSKENEQLLKGIETEILRAKDFIQLSAPGAVIPVNFPFTIHNYGSGDSFFLCRDYEGEQVAVELENPTVYCNRQCNNYNKTKSSSFHINLTVCVGLRSKRLKFELKCGACPDGISVYTVKDFGDDGVHMSDLGENLEEEFGKYLEARGITLSTTNFIYNYMLHKTNQERLRILENIQRMVAN